MNGEEQFGAWPAEHEFMRPFIGGITIEIGCFKGWTTRFLARHCAQLICIDPWDGAQDGSTEHIYNEFCQNTNHLDNLTVIRARSQDVDLSEYTGKITAALIDGLHTYEGCLADIRMIEPLLTDTGTLFVHDVFDDGWPGVRQAVFDHLNKSGRTAEFFAYYPTPSEQQTFQHSISGLAYWKRT